MSYKALSYASSCILAGGHAIGRTPGNQWRTTQIGSRQLKYHKVNNPHFLCPYPSGFMGFDNISSQLSSFQMLEILIFLPETQMGKAYSHGAS